MPEYVYALHDFVPENEDEISFSAGDRIEVIEKDELYGDGWWQGRNLFGKIGLFPQSYTTSDPAVVQNPAAAPHLKANGQNGSASGLATGTGTATPASLHTLNEESEEAPTGPAEKKGVEEGKGDSGANGDGGVSERGHGVMMRATMTDVQEAIEQLGRARNDRDGNASFSFASTHTDTDRDTDTEGRGGKNGLDEEGEEWHKGARSNLAEKARQQQELLRKEQEAYDAELAKHAHALAAPGFLGPQLSDPPIPFEMSDESEGEDEDDDDDRGLGTTTQSRMLFPRRDHEHISEEEEEDDVGSGRRQQQQEKQKANDHSVTPTPKPSVGLDSDSSPKHIPSSNPSNMDDFDGQQPPETARQMAFPTPTHFPPSQASDQALMNNVTSSPLSIPKASHTPVPPIVEPEARSMSPQSGLPSPPSSQRGSGPTSATVTGGQVGPGPARWTTVPTTEWTVDDVVEWAKSKGFDSGVTDKFVEHEISGDVLLELDQNVLKTELEIHAFGKRTRIMKEVTELKSLPSVQSASPSPHHYQYHHQRSTSQSVSLPGSAHHSLRSPMPLGAILSPESPPHTGDLGVSPNAALTIGNIRRDSDPGSSRRGVGEMDQGEHEDSSTVNNSTLGRSSALGLGIGVAIGSASSEHLESPKPKNRPAYLNLSPSDPSLKTKMPKFSPRSIGGDSKEERAALSDTESSHALESRSRRRRLFGRSTGSSNSNDKEKDGSRNSKEHQREGGPTTPVSFSTSTPASPSKRGSTDDNASVSAGLGGGGKAPQRRKKSVDANKASDRLSLFGGSLSLSRPRKPAPRIHSYAHDDLATTEKHSRSFSRLYLGGGSHRKTSLKSQSPAENNKSLDEKVSGSSDTRILRKRTTSMAIDVPALPGVMTPLKAGQSVLEQIGTPDHNGWMRKKGEHYNTWKLRYFVLKGPHLYYLRSNSKAESKIKGYINTVGYKVIVDENVNPGKYGFRLIHDNERTHYFCADESLIIREWMKALMKATIGRDYSKPVISSCNIPTIPLAVAQTMNPSPRPPSPTQRAATQKALRRENPNQLSSRDARILMGLPSTNGFNGDENGIASGGITDKAQRNGDDLFTTLESLPENPREQSQGQASSRPPTAAVATSQPPARPSRETRRTSVPAIDASGLSQPIPPSDLIRWANSYLSPNLQVQENTAQIHSGLALFRLAEAIRGKPSEPHVPDSAFPSGPNDDRLDGLFKLFDIFLDNDIRMGSVSINDVRQGRVDKIVQLLRALRAWEEKRRALAKSIGRSGAHAGAFMALEPTSASPAHAW